MRHFRSHLAAFVIAIVFALRTSAVAQPQIPKAALDIVDQQVPIFCQQVSTTRTSDGYELTGKAKAGLTSTFSKLAQVHIEGTAKYRSDKSNGVAEKDLASAIAQSDNCRLAVLNFFRDYLLPSKKPLRPTTLPSRPPAAPSNSVVTVPAPASTPPPSRSSPRHQMGPVNTTNMISNTEDTAKRLAALDGDRGIFISTTDENQDVARIVYSLFTLGESHVRASFSKPSKVLVEAPRFMMTNFDLDYPNPHPTNVPGIVIHGGGDIAYLMRGYLSNCFFVRVASKSNDDVDAYFKRKMVWVEIGPESPWRAPIGGEHEACDE